MKVKEEPSVFVIFPFEPKMRSREFLSSYLRTVIKKTAQQLIQYPVFTGNIILKKLREICGSLDYSTHKKSVAIYISMAVEKVIYLDVEVVEKIITGSTYNSKEIVSNKKKTDTILLLLLSDQKEKLFICEEGSIHPLILNSCNDIPFGGKQGNEGEITGELFLKKFIKHIDTGLSFILKAYPYPLILAGSEKTITGFKEFSVNAGKLVGTIPGNYEDASEIVLKEILRSVINDIDNIRQVQISLQLRSALKTGKYIAGIKDIYRCAPFSGGLLIVEKNYKYPGFVEEECGNNKYLYSKDAVEDIIEKVLGNGGDVEFAEEGLLNDLNIVLIPK
jgi:hypothetical protein